MATQPSPIEQLQQARAPVYPAWFTNMIGFQARAYWNMKKVIGLIILRTPK